MIVSTPQKLVSSRVEQCYIRAEVHFQRRFPRPEVQFNQRGKIAGSARLQQNQLRFNPKLLQDNVQAFVNEVVPHEVCHLLAHQLYGKVKPHGREWKTLMAELYNLNGKSTHSMDTSKVQGRTLPYRCGCGPVLLGIRRHNNVLKGGAYLCRRCGEKLKPETAIQL